LRTKDSRLDDEIEAATAALERADAGDLGDPRAHLRQDHRPQPIEEQRYGRLVELWSAISAGVLLIVLVAVLAAEIIPVWAALLIAVGGYVGIEAAIRGRLVQLALTLTLTLAVLGAIILVVNYLPLIIVAGVAVVAILAMIDNVRELRT
jgi:hypothetical protein